MAWLTGWAVAGRVAAAHRLPGLAGAWRGRASAGGGARERIGAPRRLAPGPAAGEDLDSWLNAFNEQWLGAARRIGPPLLVECLDLAARRFGEYAAGLDPAAMGGPVEWAAGADPAPVWLDIAREYMERYIGHRTWPVMAALPTQIDQVAGDGR